MTESWPIPKNLRVRLDEEAYTALHRSILERDGWRCQNCGALRNLQVHHQVFRGRSGNDVEDNLITLCSRCHEQAHGR